MLHAEYQPLAGKEVSSQVGVAFAVCEMSIVGRFGADANEPASGASPHPTSVFPVAASKNIAPTSNGFPPVQLLYWNIDELPAGPSAINPEDPPQGKSTSTAAGGPAYPEYEKMKSALDTFRSGSKDRRRIAIPGGGSRNADA